MPKIKFRLIAFFTIVFLMLFALHFFGPRLNSDDGIFLSGAWSLFNGQAIYSDFFAFVTPGAYYLIYFFWRLFGVSYGLAAVVSIVSLLISSSALYKLGRLLHPRAGYLAALLFPLLTINCPIITAHNYALALVLVAGYLFISGLVSGLNSRVLSGAFLTGLSFLFLQTIGLAALFFLYSFLAYAWFAGKASRLKPSLIFFLPVALAPLVVLLYKWSPVFLFNTLVRFPLYNYVPTLNNSYWALSGVLLALALLGIWLGRFKNIIINFLVYWQFCLFLTAWSLPDWFHIAAVGAPLLVIVAWLITRLRPEEIRFWPVSAPGVLAVMTGECLLIFYLIYFYQAAITCSSASSDRYAGLVPFIGENCHDQYIYAGPFLPFIYFETRKLPATSFPWLITGQHTAAQFAQAGRELAARKPDCAVVDYGMLKKYDYQIDNPVDDYIRENYHQFKEFNGVYILKRDS